MARQPNGASRPFLARLCGLMVSFLLLLVLSTAKGNVALPELISLRMMCSAVTTKWTTRRAAFAFAIRSSSQQGLPFDDV